MIGLYLNPPENTLVLSVDEKPTTEAPPNWWTPCAKLRRERKGVEWARDGVILRVSSSRKR
jgi:hypothetical protein